MFHYTSQSDLSHLNPVLGHRYSSAELSSPRDRYLAAIAAAEAAKAEYLGTLAREQALQRRREEELIYYRQREYALNRQRRELLLESLYDQQLQEPYYPRTSRYTTPSVPSFPSPADYGYFPPQDVQEKEALIHELLLRKQNEEVQLQRKNAIRIRKEEEVLLALARQQAEEKSRQDALTLREQARQSALLRQVEEAKRLQPRNVCGSHANLLELLSGPHYSEQTVPKIPISRPHVKGNVGAELEEILISLFGADRRAVPSELHPHQESAQPRPQPEAKQEDNPLFKLFSQYLEKNELKPQTPDRPAPTLNAPATAASTVQPKSLKEQLESRLNNEYEVEIRDTIQAILESLAPQAPTFAPESTSSTSSDKGKGKAKEQDTPQTSTTLTSRNVVDSLHEVQNIDAAFSVINNEFVFPAQLDFDFASSPTTVSDSSIPKLAYTSRNAPVRFFEQSLSALLAQLDAVESFGNEDLRTLRKEVVGRIEGALGEVEKEVEGRWRVKEKARRSSTDLTEKPQGPIDTANAGPISIPIADGPSASSSNPTPESASVTVEDVPTLISGSTQKADDVVTALEEPATAVTSEPVLAIHQPDNINTSVDIVGSEPVEIVDTVVSTPGGSSSMNAEPAELVPSLPSEPNSIVVASESTILGAKPVDVAAFTSDVVERDTNGVSDDSPIVGVNDLQVRDADAGSDWSEVEA